MPCVSFTSVTLAAMAVGLALGPRSALLGVGVHLAVFVWTSFHAAIIVDPTCYDRMRRKRGWSFALFHAGNAAVHHAPAAYAFVCPPSAPDPTHFALSVLAFLFWLLLVSNGKVGPDEVYVPLSDRSWLACYGAGLIGMCAYTAHVRFLAR